MKRYVRKSAEGDWPAVKECCTGDMLKMLNFSEKLMTASGMDPTTWCEDLCGVSYDQVKGDIDYALQDRSGDTAKVNVNVEGMSCEYQLKKVDGSWKIYDIVLPYIGSLSSMMDDMPDMSDLGTGFGN